MTKLLGVFSDVVNEREKTPVLSHDECIELAEETKGHSNVKLSLLLSGIIDDSLGDLG